MPENFKEFSDKYWMVPVLVITYWILMYVNDILLKVEHPDATIAVGLMVYFTLFNRIRILEKKLDNLNNRYVDFRIWQIDKNKEFEKEA